MPMTQEELDSLLADLVDFFSELDDGEARPFGEYADVTHDEGVITVKHPDEPHKGVRITVEPL